MGLKAKVGELDFAVRSHMLLGVMGAAVEEGGVAEGGLGGHGATSEDMGGCLACYRGGEGRDATADLGGDWAALCKVGSFRRF